MNSRIKKGFSPSFELMRGKKWERRLSVCFDGLWIQAKWEEQQKEEEEDDI